jgi:hypothetical protein
VIPCALGRKMNHLIGPLGSYQNTTPPSDPTTVTMSTFKANETTVTVTWTSVAAATSYTVTFYSNTTPTTTGGTVFQTITGATGTSQTSSNTFTTGIKYYYATVLAVNGGGSSSATTSTNVTTVFTLVSSLFLWLDAQDTTTYTLSGSNLTDPGWRDKVIDLTFKPNNGGASNSFTSSSSYPTVTGSGATRGIYFNNPTTPLTSNSIGLQANLTQTQLSLPAPNFTILTVSKDDAVNTNTTLRCLLHMKTATTPTPSIGIFHQTTSQEGLQVIVDNSAKAIRFTTPVANSTSRIISVVVSASNAINYQNGTVLTTSNSSYISQTGNYNIHAIGLAASSFGSRCWSGSLNEMMVFSSNLSTTDRQKAEGYLAWKWNLQASLPSGHTYRNTSP